MTNVGVALPDNEEAAQTLIERASELARRLNGRWVAFLICNDALPKPRAERAMQRAEAVMSSGGTVHVCEGDDVAQTLLALAKREQIDVLLLGSPKRSGLLRWLMPGVVDRVLRAARSFDVVVVGNGHGA